MDRTITSTVTGFRTQDGAGVSLVRVLGGQTMKAFDPILMLDSFDSLDPKDYQAGFPMHPHRGIETISYVVQGAMRHRDNLGHTATVNDGEVQWMTAGSGIMHEEMIPAAGRLLGVQLWLNLPAKDKMRPPAYRSIARADIPEVQLDGAKVRVLTGSFAGVQGHASSYLPLDYYDIVMEPGAHVEIPTASDRSVMLFTLLGDVSIAGDLIAQKTAVKLSAGDKVVISAATSQTTDGQAEPAQAASRQAATSQVTWQTESAHVLLMSSNALHEPIAWGGPIVMNTQEELMQAYDDLDNGKFIRTAVDYE